MSDEVASWLRYADENARVARLCLANDLLNPCIQNAQQAVEKALKARCLALGLPLKRTQTLALRPRARGGTWPWRRPRQER